MASAFHDAILGQLAISDQLPAETTEVFFKVHMHEDASSLVYLDALMELKDRGFITVAGHHWTNWLCRFTEYGRRP